MRLARGQIRIEVARHGRYRVGILIDEVFVLVFIVARALLSNNEVENAPLHVAVLLGDLDVVLDLRCDLPLDNRNLVLQMRRPFRPRARILDRIGQIEPIQQNLQLILRRHIIRYF